LAGLEQPDDAAVWKLDEERGLVVTTDFFTPIVDDPYDFGAIAATNSISDIYAMGAKPFMALNVAALPLQLPAEIISEILRGGAEKAREAGVVIAGGHTIQDKEPKYGLVVLGFVELSKIMIKGGLQPGDTLFLTKPIGTGIINTAIKSGKLSEQDASEVIKGMKTLNDKASLVAQACGVRGATDITGFSLLGHAWEMATASHVGIRFQLKDIPLHPNVKDLANEWNFPGGGFNNAEYFGVHVHFADDIPQETRMILFDPQTSGGLLFAVPAKRVATCERKAVETGLALWKVGEVTDTGYIEVV